MAQRKTLTEDQLGVLRWIASGCPDGTYEDHFHRISAAALKRRGLVVTSGRGSAWTAEATPQGLDYLKAADGPNPPVPRAPNRSVAQQLVDDALAAGGEISLPRRDFRTPGVPDYRQRVLSAERQGLVPDGKRLEVETRGDSLVVSLVDDPNRRGGRLELVPVEVPEKVARYHPVVRTLRDRSDMQEVSRALMPRAMRLAQAIVIEAERRGWTVFAGWSRDQAHRRDDALWTPAKQGQLGLTVRDCSFGLRIREDGVKLRGPWEEQIARYRSFRYSTWHERPVGAFDADASGILQLELIDPNHGYQLSGRQVRWSDRQSWKLEERLPHFFREVEERVEEWQRILEQRRRDAEAAERRRQQEADQRQRDWEQHMEAARSRLQEESRVAVLADQVERWRSSVDIRQLCELLDLKHGSNPASREWIEWARDHANRIDPTSEAPAMPMSPEATPEALQRHMPKGWSAKGPDQPPVYLDDGGSRLTQDMSAWSHAGRHRW